ncbi:cytochrome o ubiquinol oxidase subunit IV [Fulvimarina endophytica]|uniref:Cytochrome bo(3) ubiquinol oxidase subunit 4 n=1 Tax=Fulvimarina endophytica TaxID=2293836 RepID=A0A371X0R8_9HYPH|nr:cytochrome o ubiquinol oxidase subunit IV [Fulvimarina endophytica]
MAHSTTAKNDPHSAAQVDHDHAGHMEGGEAHATLKGYLTGFVLSVIMTAIPFWLVMARPIESSVITALLVIGFALAQIFVHMVYFLHMDSKSENGWTIMALIFTGVLVIITISGSLWVMYHLNTNMMPTSGQVMESETGLPTPAPLGGVTGGEAAGTAAEPAGQTPSAPSN